MSIILFTIHLSQKVHPLIGRLLTRIDHPNGLGRFVVCLRLHALVVHNGTVSLIEAIHVRNPLLVGQLQIDDLFIKFQNCLEVANSIEMIVLEVAHFTDIFPIIDILQPILLDEALIR